MYIDLLDSVKTAHPLDLPLEKWWRPKDEKNQAQAIAISHAAIMIRLLYGDTITLSHHQILDSCGWLSGCSSLVDRARELPFPPVSWAAYRVADPKPEDLVRKAVEVFKPGNDEFKLSAWAGLEPGQKQKISDEINKTGSFESMLHPVITSLDSSFLIKYKQQQEALIKFHEYLKSPYTWHDTQPLMAPCHGDNPISLWKGTVSRRNRLDGIQGIPEEILNEINNEIVTAGRDLELRSNLYTAISRYDPAIRLQLRKIIDYYYNLKISYSTDKGAGLRSILDQEADTRVADDLSLLQDMDSSDIANQQEIYTFVPGEFTELSTLDFGDFIKVLKDNKELRSSIQLLRDFKAVRPEKNDPDYQEWISKLDEATDIHENLLAKELKGNIQLKGQKLGVVVSSAVFGLVIPVAFGGLIKVMDLGIDESIADKFSTGIAGLLGSTGQAIADKIDQTKNPASAVARIHHKFARSVKRNL